jgi:hypothetical protein
MRRVLKPAWAVLYMTHMILPFHSKSLACTTNFMTILTYCVRFVDTKHTMFWRDNYMKKRFHIFKSSSKSSDSQKMFVLGKESRWSPRGGAALPACLPVSCFRDAVLAVCCRHWITGSLPLINM